MKDSAVITLKKGEGRLLKSGGAWIFDNEIAYIKGSFLNGDVVSVRDFDGYPMGKGVINMNSKIRVRMLTRDKDTEIDREFLTKRLRAAWDYRRKTVDTSSCRIVFGDADFLPGITIDKYEDILVIESLSLGMDRMKELILDILTGILAEDGIKVRGIYERSDAKERLKEGTLLTWRKVRRRDFSLIRNITARQSGLSAAEPGCWTALHTRGHLRLTPLWRGLKVFLLWMRRRQRFVRQFATRSSMDLRIRLRRQQGKRRWDVPMLTEGWRRMHRPENPQ